MRHDVDLEGPVPVLVAAKVGAERHAGVGAPQVDRADLALHPVDERGHGRGVGHVQPGAERGRAGQLAGDAAGAGLVEVGDDDGARALPREPQRQRPPDP